MMDARTNRIKLKCPECGYEYEVEGEPYEMEHCPLCGHYAKFEEFRRE